MLATVMPTVQKYEIRKNQTDFPAVKITGSDVSAEFIRRFYGDDLGIYESCFILLLNAANTTIGYAKISQGGIMGTVVDPRIVAKYAVESLATAVIIAHNHPSGNLRQSRADEDLTKKIKQGLQLLEIVLLDHIILTEEGYMSFADDGLMY